MATFLKNKALTFADVHLVPRFSDIKSRKTDVSLSVSLKRTNRILPTPFIASPMDTVSGPEMCAGLQSMGGGFGIIHRYVSIEQQSEMISRTLKLAPNAVVGAAVGVNGDFIERAQAVLAAGASLLCVDIAHGHHELMKEALLKLRSAFPDTHIMAGNVATIEGFDDLSDWGADSIRLGVGSGSICSTRVQTGCGYPMLQNILDVAKTTRPAQIISDGGIREFGDIVKALAAGAHFVMMGSMFAGTDESPGELVDTQKGMMKTYRGMASKEAQTDWRGFHSSNEGVSTMIPYKGTLSHVLSDMINGVATGLSYNGARNLKDLRDKAVFVEVSASSAVEATPHILRK